MANKLKTSGKTSTDRDQHVDHDRRVPDGLPDGLPDPEHSNLRYSRGAHHNLLRMSYLRHSKNDAVGQFTSLAMSKWANGNTRHCDCAARHSPLRARTEL
jgi:hypothetical protein